MKRLLKSAAIAAGCMLGMLAVVSAIIWSVVTFGVVALGVLGLAVIFCFLWAAAYHDVQ